MKMAKKNEAKTPKPEEVPEELMPNHVTMVHVDGDIRMSKAVRDQLNLKPDENWKFSIVASRSTSL